MKRGPSISAVRLASADIGSASVLLIPVLLLSNALLPHYAGTLIATAYVLYYVVTSQLVIPRSMMLYLRIPFVLFLIGLLGSIGNEPYDILKDCWYYASPFIVFSAGYCAMHRIVRMEVLLRYFVICGAILACVHLLGFGEHPWQLTSSSIEAIHREEGGGSFLVILSITILLMARQYQGDLLQVHQRLYLWPLLLVNALSLVLSLSRTLWISLGIMLIAIISFRTQQKFKALVLTLLSLVLVIIVMNYLSLALHPDRTTVMGKLITSLDELFIRDYSFMSDLHYNWRGYESFMAWKTYIQGNIVNLLAGHGFGKLVDLEISMTLGGELFRFIPILHNGYLYLLVKTGIAGLLLFLVYFLRMVRDAMQHAAAADPDISFAGRMIIASILVVLFTTVAISGIFNKVVLVPLLFLVGALLAYLKMRSAQEHDGARMGAP